jgi:hypothetical protein
MKNRTNAFLLFLSVLLLISIGLNIYQMVQANAQQARIINFIPQAVNLQDENQRLQVVEEKQKAQIEELSYFKDSILQVHQTPATVELSTGAASQQASPGYNPKANTDQTFRDLNKNVP